MAKIYKKLKKQIHKSCEKISKTLFEEIKKVHHLADGEELSSHFWGRLPYFALLKFSEIESDVYVSAEIADLFGSKNLKDPAKIIKLIDINQIEFAMVKHLEKLDKKSKKT